MDFYGYMGSPDAFSPDAERDFSFAGRAEHDGAESVEGPVLKAAEGDMGSRVAVVGRDDFCGTGDAEGQVVVCRRDEVSVLVEDADIGEDEPFLRAARRGAPAVRTVSMKSSPPEEALTVRVPGS